MKFKTAGLSRRGFLVSSIATSSAVAAPIAPAEGAVASPLANIPNASFDRADRQTPSPDTIGRIVQAVKLAVENLLVDGLDDVFPRPFELSDLALDPKLRRQVEMLVTERLREADYNSLKRAVVVKVPKRNQDGFRRITIIDIVDYVTYLALCLLIAQDVEPKRPPLSKRHVYSCRYAPNLGKLFRRDLDFAGFRKAVGRRLARNRGGAFATADIANFFGSVSPTRLSAQLNNLDVDRWVTDALVTMLNHWEQCGVTGLPIGSNASRILGETLLIPVDNALSDNGIDYVRFMDDFRIFAPDMPTANTWLESLSTCLAESGFSLQDCKTTVQRIPASINLAQIQHRDSNLRFTVNAYLVDMRSPAA